jgi:hypothetical protein
LLPLILTAYFFIIVYGQSNGTIIHSEVKTILIDLHVSLPPTNKAIIWNDCQSQFRFEDSSAILVVTYFWT